LATAVITAVAFARQGAELAVGWADAAEPRALVQWARLSSLAAADEAGRAALRARLTAYAHGGAAAGGEDFELDGPLSEANERRARALLRRALERRVEALEEGAAAGAAGAAAATAAAAAGAETETGPAVGEEEEAQAEREYRRGMCARYRDGQLELLRALLEATEVKDGVLD
jgi:hypothetical protein